MRIGVVAGEASGDLLGAELIAQIRQRHPEAKFEGIAGPRMRAQGCEALFPSEKLAVMGLFEVLKHLPELLAIRRRVREHFLANPPDVFVGIDAPDFNLGLEQKLRERGIRTVHYVSPSVWAWREKRVHGIARSVDRILTLFPFEEAFYERHGVAATFVGHPLADSIDAAMDQQEARRLLQIPADGKVVALLPGSRRSEVERLAALFVRTAAICAQRNPSIQFVAPMANEAVRGVFEQALASVGPQLPLRMLDGQAQTAMAASDVVLLASGTATLEAMLLKRPMVVAYRLSALTFWLVRALRLIKISRFALPNLLSGEAVVPEFIQGKAQPEAMAEAIMQWLEQPQRMTELKQRFDSIHHELRRNASARAAEAVLEVARGG